MYNNIRFASPLEPISHKNSQHLEELVVPHPSADTHMGALSDFRHLLTNFQKAIGNSKGNTIDNTIG